MHGFRDVVREMSRRITSGFYPVNSVLPSRLELLSEFGVSRVTLDRAIRELEMEHKLSCRRGSGTYVLPVSEHRCLIAWVGNPSAELRSVLGLSNQVILPDVLKNPSDWQKLNDFDGILWDCPRDFLLPAIRKFQGRLPQVVINRTLPDISCVSTDHRGAFHDIVQERLAAHPDGIPVLLQSEPQTLPAQYRFEGFADACREQRRFYELWSTPMDFMVACRLMKEKFSRLDPTQPWLIFSDSKYHTGAVMRVAFEFGWEWRKKQFYSDFDNDLLEDVWGWRVTSFLQDAAGLRKEAGSMLKEMIDTQNFSEPRLKLLYPKRVNGDT